MNPRHVTLSVWHQQSRLVQAVVTWPKNLDIPAVPDTDVLVMADGETEVEFSLARRMMFAKRDVSYTMLSLLPSTGEDMTEERARHLIKESFGSVEFLLS